VTARIGRLLVVGTLAFGLLAACGDGGDDDVASSGDPSDESADDGTTTTTAATTTSSATGGVAVTVQNTAFNPATVTAKTGETITFTSKDSVPHTVTPDTAGAFTGGDLSGSGSTVKVTITKSGSYAFHCNIHASMKGTITIT
jgi:plastocyanin